MPALLPEKGPPRLLAVATLVNTLGYGVYLAAGVLYFTRVVHLPAAQIGLGLTVAGGIGLVAGIPVGALADRRGARNAYAVALLFGAVAMAGLCLANGFWSFLLFASLGSAAQTAGPAARSPLIQEYGGERPAEYRGYLRSVTNLGIAVGAVLAGLGIQSDTRGAYLLLIAGTSASYAACACMVMFLPAVPPMPPGTGPKWIALRDRPYLLLTALDGLMAIQYRVLTAAVPLWLISKTFAPRWSISMVMLVNTAIVVLFQVRASKRITTLQAGAVAFRRAGFAFFLSCVVISLMAGVPTWLAIALLLGAVVVHTVGEIWHAAGGFEVSFLLAPPHAIGQYQGLFGMGLGLGIAIGPALLITLCIGCGTFGWWAVGTLFVLTGLAVPVAVRWADEQFSLRHRQLGCGRPVG